MTEFIIREYREEDLPALAVHWKQSTAGWPPGSFPCSDWSTEAARRWLFQQKHLGEWIAVDGDKIIGFVDYAVHADELDAGYIPLLNAHPDYHGKGVGRELLRTVVGRAVEDGFKRLDLHTWAGNLKAVPLYKKTGFFWRPRTDVHMYNFLPTVLRNPVVVKFLGDADWYHHMRQDLSVREDEDLIDGCRYHRYVFEVDGGKLEVRVDPSTSGVTGIISDELEVHCILKGDKHVAGLSYPVEWIFRNHKSKPLKVSLACSATDSVDYDVREEFELAGDTSFETTAALDPDVQPKREEWWGYPLDCRVSIDDAQLEFQPGLRATPPFALDIKPAPVLLAPGESRRFTFNLTSHFPMGVTFRPEVITKGALSLTEGIPDDAIEIPPEGGIGLQISAEAGDEEGDGKILVGGKVQADDQEVEIKPLAGFARVVDKRRPVIIRDENPKKAYLTNGAICVTISRDGGFIEFLGQTTQRRIIVSAEAGIGEPFSLEMRGMVHDLVTKEGPTEATAVLRAASRDFPGMVLEQCIRLGTGNEIDVWQALINESDEPFSGRVRLPFYRVMAESVVIPLSAGLTEGDIRFWMSGTVPLPAEPSAYAEPWLAYKGRHGITGLLTGAYDAIYFNNWDGAPRFEWAVEELPPSDRVEFPRVTIIADAPGIDYVRRAALGDAERRLGPYPRNAMHLRYPLFCRSNEKAPLEFNFVKNAQVEGSVEFRIGDGEPHKVSSEEWNISNPIRLEVPIEGKTQGIIPLRYKMQAAAREESGESPLVILPQNTDVKITGSHEAGYKTYTIDNGAYRFKVSPKYQGTLWWWSASHDEGNLLKTPFPEEGQYTWLNPWYGGISVGAWIDYRFHKSGFDGAPDELELFGHKWKGVRVDISPLHKLSTLRMESFFLTLPGAPIVMNLLRLSETTGCRRSIFMNGGLFARLGENGGPTFCRLCSADGEAVIKQEGEGGEHKGRLWASITESSSGRTLGLIAPQGDLFIWDQSELGQMPWWECDVNTHPERPTFFVSYYCVADDPAKVPLLARELKYWEP